MDKGLIGSGIRECPQETSELQAVARALCIHAIRQRRRWDTPAEEVEAMIAKGDVVDMAWRGFIWEAAVAISALESRASALADATPKSPSPQESGR